MNYICNSKESNLKSQVTTNNDQPIDISLHEKYTTHKLESLAIARSLEKNPEFSKIASRIKECGSFVTFSKCPKGHSCRVSCGNFCHCRSCIFCAWQRSKVLFYQLLAILHEHKKLYRTDIPVFLTLTVPNCPGEDLRSVINDMSKGFVKLMRRKPVSRVVNGWFRALEVPYNRDSNTYHPHYHCILMLPQNYFRYDRGLYLPHDEWLRMWQESMQDFSISQVDIRKVRKRKGSISSFESVVAEVAKYATKPSSYIERISENEFYADPKVVDILYRHLKYVRLIGFGGSFKTIRARLKQEQKEGSFEIKLDCKDHTCDICGSELVSGLAMWLDKISAYLFKLA